MGRLDSVKLSGDSFALSAPPERGHPALERAEALPAARPWAAVAASAGVAALAGAAVFAGGGSSDSAIFPIGAGAVTLALGLAAAAALDLVPWPRIGATGVLCLALLGSFGLWSALSVTWSIAPDRSWDSFNRTLVYVAFLACGMFLGALVRRSAALVAAGLGVLVATALAWSLAGKVFPSLVEDGGRIARLREPVGYWNGLSLLFAVGLPLALWLVSRRESSHALRALGALFTYGLVVATLLTYSRGGILAAAVALAAWLVVSHRRLESVAALGVALPVAGAVFAFALGRPGLVEDGQALAVRSADGRAFGIALLAGALMVFALAYALSALEAAHPVTPRTRSGLRRAAVALLAAGAVVAVAALVAGRGFVERQVDEFANPPTELVTQEASRLTSVSSNNRWSWWNEAWDAFQAAPVTGNGAGSFATVHRLLREDTLTVTQPHDAVLQFLADTGVVGSLLAVGAAASALAGIGLALRRLGGRERQAACALAAGVLAYVVHALVDFDWEFLALTAPALVATGVLLAAGRPSRAARAPWLAFVAAAGLAACVVSLGAPWLAERRAASAYVELGRGDAEAAIAAAESARSLDPLSLDPLFALAAARTVNGDVPGARAALVGAVELQPLDPDAWLELGAFEERLGNDALARRYLQRASQLDPHGRASGRQS